MAEGEQVREFRRSADVAAEFEEWIPKFIESYRSDPLGVLLIVPSRAARDMVWDAMLKQGLSIIGTPVCTLPELVKKLFTDWNMDGTKLERSEAELALSRVLNEGIESVPELGKYRECLHQITPEVYELINVMRDHLIDYPASLAATPFHAHTDSIVQRYLEFLKSSKLYDERSCIAWVAEELRRRGGVLWKEVTVYSLGPTTPLSFELLKALLERTERSTLAPSPDWPYDKAGCRFLEWYAPHSRVLSPQIDQVAPVVQAARYHYFDSREEAAAIADSIHHLLKDGARPRDIAILLASDNLAPLLWDALEDAGVPCNARHEKGLLASPLVQMVIGLVRLPSSDFGRQEVVDVLRSPYVRVRLKENEQGRDERLRGGRLDKLAKEAGIIKGKNAWGRMLRDHADTVEKRPDENVDESEEEQAYSKAYYAGKAAELRSTAMAVERFISNVERLEGDLTDAGRIEQLRSLFKEFNLDRNTWYPERSVRAREARALTGLIEILDEMTRMESMVGGTPRGLGSFADSLEMSCQNHSYMQEFELEDAVELMGIRHSSLLRRDHIFIPGLSEGSMPNVARRIPLLREDEAEALGIVSREDVLAEEKHFFLMAKAAARRSLHLSFSRTYMDDYSVPSQFLDDVVSPCSISEADHLVLRGQALFRLGMAMAGLKPIAGLELDLHSSLEELNARAMAEARRSTQPYSSDIPGDGYILGQEEVLKEKRQNVHSATSLQEYTTCPFNYLMRRLYAYKEVEEPDDDPDAAVTGDVLHRILYVFHRELKASHLETLNKEDGSLSRAHEIMTRAAESVLATKHRTGPAWMAFEARLLGVKTHGRIGLLHYYVDHLAEKLREEEAAFVPHEFELSFPTKEAGTTSFVEVPVVGASIDRIRVTGAIDRIDIRKTKGGTPDLFITDFKTGGVPTLKMVDDCTALQLPLYAFAATKLLGHPTYGAEFLKIENDGKFSHSCKKTTDIPEPSKSKAEDGNGEPTADEKKLKKNLVDILNFLPMKLGEIINGISSGTFHPSINGKGLSNRECRGYCPYSAICRYDEVRMLSTSTQSAAMAAPGGQAPMLPSAGEEGVTTAVSAIPDEEIPIDKSVCVTAGAGAGKTRALVKRYVTLVADGHAEVGEILAITFTNKAAAEMRDRVRQELQKMAECERRAIALRDLHWGQISTFHSFCADLLKDNAIAAGLAPGFSVLSEGESKALIDACIEETLRQGPPHAVKATAELMQDVNPKYAKECLLYLHQHRGVAGAWLQERSKDNGLDGFLKGVAEAARLEHAKSMMADSTFLEDVRNLVGYLEKAESIVAEELKTPLGKNGKPKNPVAEKDRDKLAPFIIKLAPSLALVLKERDPDMMWKQLVEIDEQSAEFKSTWGRGVWGSDKENVKLAAVKLLGTKEKEGSAKRNERGSLASQVDPLFLNRESDVMRNLAVLYGCLLESISGEKRRLNVVDFEDLILLATKLLNTDEGARERLARRFRHILIDEFQDTDQDQAELIWTIMRSANGTTKILIVGDPQQSIYWFRGVDVSHFHHAKKIVLDEWQGVPRDLNVNYRAAPRLVSFINHLFSRMMDKQDEYFQNLYNKMSHSLGRNADKGSIDMIHIAVDNVAKEARDFNRDSDSEASPGADPDDFREAGLVADWILSAVRGQKKVYVACKEENARYGDIAILLRSRKRVAYLEKALMDRNIPYRVHEGNGFFSRQEVLDLRNILASLNDLYDDISLYGVLRSPYFGLTDSELFPFAVAGRHKRSLWKELRKEAERDKKGKVAKSVGTIWKWHGLSGRLPVSKLLNRIVDDSDIMAVLGAQNDGERRRANVQKLIALAVRAENDGRGSMGNFLAMIEQAIDEEEKEGEGQSMTVDEDAVSIMTIHAAKGLEFPIVVLPFLASELTGSKRAIGFTEAGLGLRIPDPNGRWEKKGSILFSAWAEENRAREEAENKRLLYVAMTRAKDHLMLSGHNQTDKKDSWMKQVVEHLQTCDLVNHIAQSQPSRQSAMMGFLPLSKIDALLRPLPAPRERRRRLVLSATEVKCFQDAEEKRRGAEKRSDGGSVGGNHFEEFERSYIIGMPSSIAESRLGSMDVKSQGTFFHEVLRGRDPMAVSREMGLRLEALSGESLAIRKDFTEKRSRIGGCGDICEAQIRLVIGGETFTGAIDRLIPSEEGWKIVDYKRAGGNAKEDEELDKEHSIQLAIYRQAAGSALQADGSCYLYLMRDRAIKEMPSSPEKLQMVADLAKDIRAFADSERMPIGEKEDGGE